MGLHMHHLEHMVFASKSSVSSIKTLSIPKLEELQGAILFAKLNSQVHKKSFCNSLRCHPFIAGQIPGSMRIVSVQTDTFARKRVDEV